MAYTMKVEGMDGISKMLSEMSESAPGVASQAVYKGAGIMRDAVAGGAESIRTEKFHYAVFPGTTTRLPSPEEKEIVLQAEAGIAKFDKNGTEVQTSVGYSNSGYAVLKGRVVPIPVIVNAINSGTSFMHKQPFVRKAARKAKAKTEQAMTEVIENAWYKIYHEVYDKYGGR